MIDLRPHPGSRLAAVRAIRAEAVRDRGRLALRYRIEGDLAALRLPLRGERPLWRHTCCEAFVAAGDADAYLEFNLSPSGDWAAYAFSDYRAGAPIDVPDPGIVVTPLPDGMELTASVQAADGRLRIALTAVVEARDGTLSYWALRHPPGKPDFHHREGFALELA